MTVAGPLRYPSWPLLLPQFEDIIKYHCTYGPKLTRPFKVARVPIEQPPVNSVPAAGHCGCQYHFAVYYLRQEPALARIERALMPQSAHTSDLCRWISTAGRKAVTQAFEDGQRGCPALKRALLRSIEERFGVRKGERLTDEDVQRLFKTRPDLARDYLATSQDILCVGV